MYSLKYQFYNETVIKRNKAKVEVIVKTVDCDEQPEVFTLGVAVDTVISTLQCKIDELEKWRDVSNQCDFWY